MSGPSDDDDVVAIGRDHTWLRRPPAMVVVLAAVSLLIGLAVGYAAGDKHGRGGAAAPAQSPAATTTTPLTAGMGVGQTGNECSAQVGRSLQLGVQVMNMSARGVVLHGVTAILPMGGLRQTGQAWGPCGELPPTNALPDVAMPAGASTWFTVTFDVLVKCPGPYPVQFTVQYELDGRPATVKLPGFVDLGHIPYGTCPAS
jgi:hypothetical protein